METSGSKSTSGIGGNRCALIWIGLVGSGAFLLGTLFVGISSFKDTGLDETPFAYTNAQPEYMSHVALFNNYVVDHRSADLTPGADTGRLPYEGADDMVLVLENKTTLYERNITVGNVATFFVVLFVVNFLYYMLIFMSGAQFCCAKQNFIPDAADTLEPDDFNIENYRISSILRDAIGMTIIGYVTTGMWCDLGLVGNVMSGIFFGTFSILLNSASLIIHRIVTMKEGRGWSAVSMDDTEKGFTINSNGERSTRGEDDGHFITVLVTLLSVLALWGIGFYVWVMAVQAASEYGKHLQAYEMIVTFIIYWCVFVLLKLLFIFASTTTGAVKASPMIRRFVIFFKPIVIIIFETVIFFFFAFQFAETTSTTSTTVIQG